MSKAILISIQPKWIAKILNGEKTLEIRKTMPKCDLPIEVYIYCTKDKKDYLCKPSEWGMPCPKIYALGGKCCKNYNGKVVARFWCDKVDEYINGINCERLYEGNHQDYINDKVLEHGCISDEDLFAYAMDLHFFAIHITKLEIFDKPKEISEFSIKVFPHRKDNLMTRYLTRVPQSYCYIEV